MEGPLRVRGSEARAALLLLVLHAAAVCSLENLALRGKATQSKRYDHNFAAAYNAIDGNDEDNFHFGSCTHTVTQDNPWWRVDLLNTYIITSVVITNRGDCCSERLEGLQVYIGNSLENKGLNNKMFPVDVQHRVTRKHRVQVSSPLEGRYVLLYLPGTQKILTVCEVEVFGYSVSSEENLAYQAKASQSSISGLSLPFNAIDGNEDSELESGSCSITKDELSPWWRLNLLRTYKIDKVKIRTGNKLADMLTGAEIRIGNSLEGNGNFNTRCAVIKDMEDGKASEFQCNGLNGKYVNIVMPDRQLTLVLCEVEVYGSRVD